MNPTRRSRNADLAILERRLSCMPTLELQARAKAEILSYLREPIAWMRDQRYEELLCYRRELEARKLDSWPRLLAEAKAIRRAETTHERPLPWEREDGKEDSPHA